jgi:hypothetical protein
MKVVVIFSIECFVIQWSFNSQKVVILLFFSIVFQQNFLKYSSLNFTI